ncbi:MAG: CDGSH-type Zn-finger protein [Cellvibrionaceae bacterium]|jgi:CDGSH-type Zn-finger protein
MTQDQQELLPIVSGNSPIPVDLEKDKEYYFCACGRSKSQPFCDGSHAGTGFTPKQFVAEESSTAYLCACKHTGNPPFCDGTHKQFSAEDVGKPGPRVQANANVGKQPEPVPTPEEPHVAFIHQLAREGLSKLGHHGPMTAMGVPRDLLPKWDDIQIMVAQMATKPLMDDDPVSTGLVIGPRAKKPLKLDIPLFVSDMSFGALSEEAKVSLARGAELAGTGICSGEGGMLPEEQQENGRYFYELASAMFGYDEALLTRVQAFHFKGGQGAKTGTGGHLPGNKNRGKISKVRGIPEGEPAISPPTFRDLTTPEDFCRFADRVREITGGIPIGFKLSANHIEQDMQFAIDASADYIILDGRGGGTGAAPSLFRDHISVPTIPALSRARHFLDQKGLSGEITLIATGGLRSPADFVKAMCLGADGIALSNAPMQAIGCVGARICNTNNCPAGIATQRPELRARLNVQVAAERLARFFGASTDLMKVMARACGHDELAKFNVDDIATWNRDLSELSGIKYSGAPRRTSN